MCRKKSLINKFDFNLIFSGYLLLPILLFLSSFLVEGCNRYYKSTEVTSQSLVGVWLPSSASSLLYGVDNKNILLKNTQLILSEDNSFELKNMPNCWEMSTMECYSSSNSYNGTWSFLKDKNGNYSLILNIRNPDKMRGIEIDSGRDAISLYFFVGDPDTDRKIVFTKNRNQ